MKSILSSAMLVLTLSLIASSTTNGQTSSVDSVTITRDQQRQCIKWYYTVQNYRDTVVPIKDSIIGSQKDFIVYQEGIIDKQSRKISKAKTKQRNTGIIAGSGAALITSLLFLLLGP